MCKLFITDDGTLIAPAMIRIPATNLVAGILKNNPLVMTIKPTEDNVSFIVDTGAQVTCLSGLDADRLHIETRYLEPTPDIIGVGGKCSAFKLCNIEIGLIDKIEGGRITFHIEKLDHIYVVTSLKMASLLGTDLLQRFDIVTKRAKSSAELKRIPSASWEFQIVSRELVISKKRLPKK